MMKYVKIFFVFIVLVGGIFLAASWTGLMVGSGEPPITLTIDVDDKCSEIRDAWSTEKNWNEQLFISQKSDLDQDKGLGRYEFEDDAETVLNTIRESATDKLCEAIFREFGSADCNDNLVKQNYAGEAILSTTFDMESDARLQKVRSVKSLYDKISDFVSSNHEITANYDAKNNMWTPFPEQRKRILDTAKGYRKNTLYNNELKNIKRFIDGLDDSYLCKVIDGQKIGFYSTLSDQIVICFKNLSQNDDQLTKANLDRFNDVYDRYSKETSLDVTKVATAYRAFKNLYEKKMKKNETANN